jgi:hypothetical protein
MSDRLESFYSEMLLNFLKINLDLFKFSLKFLKFPKYLIYRQVLKFFLTEKENLD